MAIELSDAQIKKVVSVVIEHLHKLFIDPRIDEIDRAYIVTGALRMASAQLIMMMHPEDFSAVIDEIKKKTIKEYEDFIGDGDENS